MIDPHVDPSDPLNRVVQSLIPAKYYDYHNMWANYRVMSFKSVFLKINLEFDWLE